MLIIHSVRCRFCRGKLELHGEGFVLVCPACKKGTRLPRKLSLSELRPEDYTLSAGKHNPFPGKDLK